MVLLHMKRSDEQQFLYEGSVNDSVKDTIKELVKIHNLRQRATRLKLEGEELAKYGPAKEPDKEGIDEFVETPIEKNEFYTQDPTGRRTGNGCDPRPRKALLDELQKLVDSCHKNLVANKQCLTSKIIEDGIDHVRGAIMMCYPMGLPEWDLVRQCVENNEDLGGTSYGAEEMDPQTTSLWFAGKELQKEKFLMDYLGRHEKTKAVVKLQKKGQGAPSREPTIDKETHTAMLSWYRKRTDQQKQLEEDEDDTYENQPWANPRSLKQHFSGVGSVKVPR